MPLDYISLICGFDEFLKTALESHIDYLKAYWEGRDTVNPIVALSELLEAFDRLIAFMSKINKACQVPLGNHMLELRRTIPTVEKFESILTDMEETYHQYRSKRFQSLQALNEEEQMRMNEAWHCLSERCYYSAIINSGVALERRLWHLLEPKNPDLVSNLRNYPRLSLGQLSNAYLNNREAFDEMIPEEYDNVLRLVNDYRNIAAHAKQILVNDTKAEGLFGFVLEFLLDPRCAISH